MKELLVCTCRLTVENGKERSYDYSILVDEMQVNDQISYESYGVKVAEQDGAEVALVPNITVRQARIDELMELLTRNVVTPCTLTDVVLDWL